MNSESELYVFFDGVRPQKVVHFCIIGGIGIRYGGENWNIIHDYTDGEPCLAVWVVTDQPSSFWETPQP